MYSLIFGYSAYKGLYSGIAKIADINTYACLALVAFVIVVGPTLFLISLYCDSIGVLFNNLFRLSFYTDPISQSGIPQNYTAFYWAWWATYAVFMGLFIARISRGRTIRQIAFAVTTVGALGSSIFYLSFGGFAVEKIMMQGIDLHQMQMDIGGQNVVIYLLNQLPFHIILIPIFFVVMTIFTAATLNAAAYTMAMMGCKEIQDGEEPPKWTRALWSGALMIIAVSLLVVGGGTTVQLSAILTSVPILFIMLILIAAFMKNVRSDFGGQIKTEMLVFEEKEEEKESAK